MPGVVDESLDDRGHSADRLSFPQEKAHQAALRQRTRGKRTGGAGQPILGGVMMHVVLNHQRDKDVRV